MTISILLGLGMFQPAHANNIQVGTPTFTGQNTSQDYTFVQFDLSWENSWRKDLVVAEAPYNYDAAWVFVKYKVAAASGGDGLWRHATLNTSGHTAPTGSTIDTPTDGKGVFIYRNANGGASTFSLTDVGLRWNYGSDLEAPADNIDDADLVTVKVFVIEMVYIPAGSFYIGDGNGSTESTYAFHTGTGNSAVEITDSLVSDIRVDTNSGDDSQIEDTGIGIDGDGGIDTDDNGAIDNANFPTGYTVFYCMKYEISQGQYADFLNTLTYDQQNTRTVAAPNSTGQVNSNSTRNGLEVQTAGTDNTVSAIYGIDLNNDDGNLGEHIAANYLSWADGAAYADWAGLRPMTELEFEKGCRGAGQAASSGEYAWGNTTLGSATSSLSNAGQANETPNQGNCNYDSCSPDGPYRVGSYADASSSRQNAGASYYGVMEMSGNSFEYAVTVGNGTGRSFAGAHGDGALDANGNADASNWPDTGAVGTGFRGGSWNSDAAGLRVSRRSLAAYTYTDRSYNVGFRCVRLAP